MILVTNRMGTMYPQYPHFSKVGQDPSVLHGTGRTGYPDSPTGVELLGLFIQIRQKRLAFPLFHRGE